MTEHEPQEAGWVDEIVEGERACPVCGARMHIERKGSVSIDACNEHGVWLDKGELERIATETFLKDSKRRWANLKRERRQGKIQGAMWGWWSLLYD